MNTQTRSEGHPARKVVILGAGGFAREVADVYRDLNGRSGATLLGYVDKDIGQRGVLINGLPMLGMIEDVPRDETTYAILGVGHIALRRKIIEQASIIGFQFDVIVHPSVIMTESVAVGAGTVVCAGAILTNLITLGQHVLVNLGCTVGHDVTLGDNVILCPGVHVSGRVKIESECYIGTGAVLLDCVTIHRGATVGAGAVVTKDIPAGCVAVGVPAKVIKSSRTVD